VVCRLPVEGSVALEADSFRSSSSNALRTVVLAEAGAAVVSPVFEVVFLGRRSAGHSSTGIPIVDSDLCSCTIDSSYAPTLSSYRS